jgi:hypothetical protein
MFNVWTACTTLAQIAEELDRSDLHFVLVDRGLFDALWWFEWMQATGKLSDGDKTKIWDFFSLEPWAKLIDVVFVMKTSPKMAMQRERQFLPTEGKGKIMDPVVLGQLNDCIARVTRAYGSRFRRIVEIETENDEANREAQNLRVIDEALTTLEGFLDESLLVFPKSELSAIGVVPGLIRDDAVIERLMRCLEEKARPVRKSIAEQDGDSVMVVPCGVIRHKDEVLLLRRREIDAKGSRRNNSNT